MQPWSYGCTPEVAKHERSIRVAECGSSFLSACFNQLNLPSAYVVVNFLFQLIFSFPLFWGMVMYANEFKTKEKQKLTEIKN